MLIPKQGRRQASPSCYRSLRAILHCFSLASDRHTPIARCLTVDFFFFLLFSLTAVSHNNGLGLCNLRS